MPEAGSDMFKVMQQEQHKSKPRILYLEKSFFNDERKIKTFPNKQKLREFISREPAL